MQSLTKAVIDKATLQQIVYKQFQEYATDISELNDGYYNISFLVTLHDGMEAVLKVAPPDDVAILTYEKDIMASEVAFYKLAEKHTDMPVPHVFGYDTTGEIVSNPYYFMSKLEGMPLNKIGDIDEVMRRDVYEVVAENLGKLHNIKGDCFGYLTMRDACEGKGVLNSVEVAVEALYDDALKKDTGFPADIEEVRDMYRRTGPAFEDVSEPCLCHFDLWDGNIFVKNERPLEVTGLIDFERGFYGCPAADLSQASGYLDIDENMWFIEKYNQYADNRIVYDTKMKVRMDAYRFYVFLIMHVECWYREIDGSFDWQKNWIAEEFPKLKDHFEALLKQLESEE